MGTITHSPGPFSSSISIDCEAASETASHIQTAELKPIADAFAANSSNLLTLFALPLFLLSVGFQRANYVVLFTEAYAKLSGKCKSAEERAAAVAEAHRIAARNPAQELDSVGEAVRELPILLKDPKLEPSGRALAYAGAVAGWASLECAAKDAWTVALNLRPAQLAKPTFGQLPEATAEQGISGRQISVGLLMRHEFDLRAKLGTLLAPKFDFSGVSGIREAYSAAFGREAFHHAALDDAALGLLEATRHVVAHRAGQVDEEYIRRTGKPYRVGEPLLLDSETIGKLANAGVTAGCNLLRGLDDWLLANPAPDRRPVT